MILIITHLIIPVGLILFTYIGKSRCKLDWFLKQIIVVLYLAILHITGSWHEINYYLRYVFELAYISGAVISYLRIRPERFLGKRNIALWLFTAVAILICAFLYATSTPLAAYNYNVEPVNLSFPFRNGVYAIINGGNGEKSKFMNQHFYATQFVQRGISSMVRFAIDIEKLNTFGFSNNKYGSKELDDYPIYGEILYSPCDGSIITASDDLQDEKIGPNELKVGSGNTIVIKMKDIYIMLGHLQKGSISVKVGDSVKTGQPIARAGNSASGIPHLHIQATKFGFVEGVPIIFDGWFPVKNNLFFK